MRPRQQQLYEVMVFKYNQSGFCKYKDNSKIKQYNENCKNLIYCSAQDCPDTQKMKTTKKLMVSANMGTFVHISIKNKLSQQCKQP